MRLLVALLFLSSHVLAKSLEDASISFSTETHPNFYDELPGPPLHTRVKRSVFAALGITTQCEPGWTGQFCENPMCNGSATAYLPPPVPMPIDHLYLPSGCPGRYYIPYDSLSYGLFINVLAAGNPYINLTDANGNLIQGTGSAGEGVGYMIYPETLAPGGYQLTIDNGGVPTADCIVEVQTYSWLNAVTGFTMTPQSDILPQSESGIDGTPMYFVTHPMNVTNPGQMRSVTIRNENSMTPIYRSVLTQRYGCAYEYYAGQFTCDKWNRYVAHVDGIDQNGYPFRRTKVFTCVEQLTTTPAPTTAPPPFTCYNGGILHNANQPSAWCFCPELFTGNQCQQPACMNGGFLAPSGTQCECPMGYWGINCDHVTCEPSLGQYLTDYKTLVLVVRNSVSMNQYIPGIVQAVKNELEGNDALANGVYSNFLLVPFIDGVYIPRRYTDAQYNDFIQALTNLGNSKEVGNCSDVTFSAIYDVFTQYVYDKSPIFLFTDAVPSDIDDWRSVTESNSRRKLPIYSFFYPQSSCNFDSLSPGYRAIQNANLYTGGLGFIVSDNNQLTSFFYFILRSTTTGMNLVYANDLDRCGGNALRSFMIDSSTEDILLMVTGENIMMTMTDPNWNSNVLMQMSQMGNSYYVYEVMGATRGEYIFSIATADPQQSCSIRVMARSQYDLFFATSVGPNNDAIDSEPVVGQPVHLVAQLNGLYNATLDPYRLFSELTITTNRNKDNIPGKPMYYSNGQYRDECGYHLYYGVANFCEYADQPFYATVFADDNQGFTIQRTTIGYCSLALTTVAPPGACQNGGVLDPETNSTCICPVGFVGDFCQQIVCQNGGTPAGAFCICTPGVSGTFCELYTCPLINPTPSSSFDGQTMVFVVAARPSMQDTWNQLATTVGDFVRDAQDHSPNWIKNWALFTVNGEEEEKIVDDPNPQAFVDGIKMVAANLSQYSSPAGDNCSVQIMSGLLYGVYKSEKRSSVYLFTDASGPDTLDFTKLYYTTMDNQITINIIQTTNTVCTPDGSLPYYIRELAYMTSGFVYESTQVSQFLPYITSMYKSGVSGQISSDDCTQGVTQYIAVDGWTQAFSIATTGADIASVNVWTPDGTEAILTYEMTLIQDPKLNLKQFLAPCPKGSAGWNYKNQFCYTSNNNRFTWYNASQYCHNIGGSLVDILSGQKFEYINFMTQGMDAWIGLTKLKMNGQILWFWDVPNGNHLQPLDPSHTNWCPNYPIDDDDKNCVISDKSNGCWKNINCYDNNLFVCQMHRYGQGMYPGDENNNIVPGGRWKVQITTKSGGCYAQVRSQSEIQMFFGFVQDPHNDFPSLYANTLSNTNYIVTNPTQLSPFQFDGDWNSMEGNLNYNFIGFNNSLTYPLTVSNRWFCGYPYVSQPFSCPDSQSSISNFYIHFSGVDQYGFAFDRYADAVCQKTVKYCNNGGSLINGQCICPAGWTGDSCSSPICQNDGVDYEGQCQCQPMFTGTFCEQPFCEPPVPTSFGDSGRTLAIILETSYNMGSTIFQMKKSLQAALDSITQDPTTAGWFSKFILYPFDSTFNKAQWYPPTISTRTIDIVNAVKAIPTMTCPGNGTCSTSCPRPFLGAIQDVLGMTDFVTPNSLVLVITRSSSEEAGVSSQLSQMLQETKAQVNFILPATDSPCSEGWSSQGVTNMYRTVQYSDGNLFVMSAVDVCSNFLTQYVPTIYKSAGLESTQMQTCGNSEVLFQVEHEMYEFTIDYYMPQTNPPFVITLTDPAGDVLPLPPSIITSDSNYLGVVQVNDTGVTRAGTYRLNIVGGNSNYCFINIRGRSTIEVFPGFVATNDGYNGAITDFAHYAPVFLESNTIVVHANGLNGGVLTYAQIVEPSVGLAHTTNLLPRDGQCSYEWYGNLPFDCNHMNFGLIVYGRDARGANFHRKYLITAVSDRPVPNPPPAQCNPQDVKQDILFMIDSSLKADTKVYSQLKAFAGNTITPYRFSNTSTQVAALTVADIAYGGFSFFAANNWKDINGLLQNLSYSGKEGQNTASGFQMVIDKFDREAQGYRPDPKVRHSIIYLTATNPTDVDSMEMANRVRRSGLYGIAVVAYQVQPTQSLTQMVPSNCLYVANTLEDLNNYGINFVRQLSCAHSPPCGM